MGIYKQGKLGYVSRAMSKKKIILKRKQGLYLKEAGHKGRGVFCTAPIKAGEVLEVSPSVLLNEGETDNIDTTLLMNYVFVVGKISKSIRAGRGIGDTDNASAVIMGIATFCNHDEKPNAEITWEEQGGVVYYSLTATRNIPKDTEICTTYGKGWFEDRD